MTSKKKQSQYNEYSFQVCGRPLALGIEYCEDRSVRISLSVTLQELEGLHGEEVDVAIRSDSGTPFNCVWRNVCEGPLPIVSIGQNRLGFAAFHFKPVKKNEAAEAVYILLREDSFILELDNKDFFTDQSSKNQTYYTKAELKKIEQEGEKRKDM